MKNSVAFLILFGFLVCGSTNAQTVCSVSSEAFADVKVYVVSSEAFADLCVYKVSSEAFVGNNEGKWYFTTTEAFAKKKIYFVSSEAFADLCIYFVSSEAFAGWKNKTKQYLMY